MVTTWVATLVWYLQGSTPISESLIVYLGNTYRGPGGGLNTIIHPNSDSVNNKINNVNKSNKCIDRIAICVYNRQIYSSYQRVTQIKTLNNQGHSRKLLVYKEKLHGNQRNIRIYRQRDDQWQVLQHVKVSPCRDIRQKKGKNK